MNEADKDLFSEYADIEEVNSRFEAWVIENHAEDFYNKDGFINLLEAKHGELFEEYMETSKGEQFHFGVWKEQLNSNN